MLLTAFPAGPLQANCYFVASGPGQPCAIVDPGQQSAEGVRAVAAEHDLRPAAVLVTHGHFDHMWDAKQVADEFGCPLWIHPADRHLLADPMAAISNESAAMLREQIGDIDPSQFGEPADVRDAVDGATIAVGDLTITVDHCPGHTPGTVAYRLDYTGPEPVSQIMFSGDFLFFGSIGRTDLVGGDHAEMLRSLQSKILTLPDDVVVLPGHGQQSSIGREKQTNPFLLELMA
ncbi:MBL fold metallo-hydrolase [Aeromicrobium duanguangcaii]|uniref:MBL fold metallo-hydrolase n=1 Tax=Aeromicrobium duanguangcaii TaxID=2968086 RepID=A0ABY5KJ81_9ACTN|nr:MBL fold metallo-hydrolase [Aeromicrobium duanguangcaii]MCD9153068.1 MBL fold metallo-hydrolase [Aeromicrobium duanguangcaii]UUI69828.1 MBL fold metallo-hydrolase [Aeromicrobium duanguangcaii]